MEKEKTKKLELQLYNLERDFRVLLELLEISIFWATIPDPSIKSPRIQVRKAVYIEKSKKQS